MNHLDLQIVAPMNNLPSSEQLQLWVDKALANYQKDSEIVIRIVDDAESAELNQQFRNKSGSTNILSFPFQAPEGVELDLLGDLVICAPLLEKQALQQKKHLHDHWAHIVVHGVLHLLGYDHIEEDQAEQMESLEVKILKELDIKDPYQEG